MPVPGPQIRPKKWMFFCVQEDFGGTIAYGMFDEFGYKEVARFRRNFFARSGLYGRYSGEQQLLELQLFFGQLIRVEQVVFMENKVSFK